MVYSYPMSMPQILRNEKDRENWSERRKEILSLISSQMFGFTPEMSFDAVSCTRLDHFKTENGFERDLYGLTYIKEEKYCGFKFTVTNREGGRDGRIILHINPFSQNPKVYASFTYSEIFPSFYLAEEGFVAVDCFVDEISADSHVHTTHDILSMYEPDSPTSWCTIGAWAWAAKEAASRLKTLGYSSKEITVCGFSRGGKTALWAAALYDEFTSVYSCESGCCGAAIFRGKEGEKIEDITRRYGYWSCGNFKQYADREEELPFDQHMLLSLIYPKPMYISSAREDHWSDPVKEFEGVSLVSRFYEEMGLEGLGTQMFPQDEDTRGSRYLSYHVREGGHDCNMTDWKRVVRFLKT